MTHGHLTATPAAAAAALPYFSLLHMNQSLDTMLRM